MNNDRLEKIVKIYNVIIYDKLQQYLFSSRLRMQKRSSLAEKFQEKVSRCDICYSDYDRYEKQPVIICTMHHTICKQCLKSLQIRGECPFCREKINFQKVVVNNYINELLPTDPVAENRRAQVRNAMPIKEPQHSINQVQLQRVYDDSYIPPNSDQYDQYYDEQQEPDRQFDQNNCWSSIKNRLKLTDNQNGRHFLYFSIFIAQIPFLFFDLLIAFNSTDHACMDTPYINRAYVLRPWLMAMGFSDASFMLILLIGSILRVTQCINFGTLKKFQFLVLLLFIVKILLWCYMQLSLFFAVINPHCSGGIFAYGIVLTILHFILILSICLASFCKR